ncbi:MAG: glycosyltransferase family 39 protein [Kiritimatiellae bacterium]|nr:glycosyltransferase family 39 protein [Kiritimatiellia bacterium]
MPADGAVKRYRLLFGLMLGVAVACRLWLMRAFPLSGDEAYHWEWSRRLAPGYYDHPPLTAFVIWLSTHLAGRSTPLTVRLPALVCLTGAAVICFLFARRVAADRGLPPVAAERAGFMAGLLMTVAPVFAFFSVYMSTDPPLLLAWPLVLYFGYRAATDGKWRDWLVCGVSLGAALLSKFLAFFILPAFGLFLLISRPDRRWIRRPHPYVAVLVGLAVFSPFLIWNATHEWATFVFNFVSRHKPRELTLKFTAELFASLAGGLSPGILLFGLYGVWKGLREYSRDQVRSSLFLVLSFLVPFAYFLVRSFSRRIGAHWPMAGTIGLMVYLPCLWEAAAARGSAGRVCSRLKWAALGLCIVMTAAVHVLACLPMRMAAMRWSYREMPDRISTSEIYELFGWEELGARTQAAYEEMLAARRPSDSGVFVICPQYGLAAAVAFYTPAQLTTHLWARHRRHGENYRFWDDFPACKGQDAVFVAKGGIDKHLPKLQEHFRTVAEPATFPIEVNGTVVRQFHIVRCYGYDGVPPRFE